MATFTRAFGGASDEAIVAFERRNDLVLPDDYRRFLLEHNGAILSYAECHVPGSGQSVLVEVLLGLGQPRAFDLDGWLDEYRNEMPPGFLIVALGSATLFILSTRADDAGVYCWDHAHAFPDSSEEGGNTYLVAPSFSRFLESLVPLT